MAVDEQRLKVRRSIEEQLGVEEAAYLIDGRPTGGWDALVTKEYLDLRLEALKGQFHDETTRLIKWFVPTFFASVAALGGILGAVMGVVLAIAG